MPAEKKASGSKSSSLQFHMLLGVLALVILVLMGTALLSGGRNGLREGSSVPPFQAQLYDGGKFVFPDPQGRSVVVHFWASWCVECRKEIPLWVKMWEEYTDRGVIFLGVNYKDPDSKAREFIETYGVKFPCARDPRGKLAGIFGVTGVPESYFITPEGVLAHKAIGPIREEMLRKWVEELAQ